MMADGPAPMTQAAPLDSKGHMKLEVTEEDRIRYASALPNGNIIAPKRRQVTRQQYEQAVKAMGENVAKTTFAGAEIVDSIASDGALSDGNGPARDSGK